MATFHSPVNNQRVPDSYHRVPYCKQNNDETDEIRKIDCFIHRIAAVDNRP
jgi:hypothetical protein